MLATVAKPVAPPAFAPTVRPSVRAPSRELVIQNAHKKGAGSTKNGRDSNPQYRGVQVNRGQPIRPGGIIVRQVGNKVCSRYLSEILKWRTMHQAFCWSRVFSDSSNRSTAGNQRHTRCFVSTMECLVVRVELTLADCCSSMLETAS